MKPPGNTPVIRLPWEGEVWVKDESVNPTGTHKDRRSVEVLRRALRDGVQKIVLISAGNAAYSLARYAEGTGIEVVPVIDHRLSQPVKDVLRRVCGRVEELDLDAEELTSDRLIEMVREADEKVMDASNGFHHAYESIVRELAGQIPEPDTIYLPVGSAETMVGVISGIRKTGWSTSVIGVHSSTSERLRNRFFYPPYAEASKGLIHEHRQGAVPEGIRAEEAASLTFDFAHKARVGNKIVILNAGYGEVSSAQ